jgi:hypothetical protein
MAQVFTNLREKKRFSKSQVSSVIACASTAGTGASEAKQSHDFRAISGKFCRGIAHLPTPQVRVGGRTPPPLDL